MEHMKRYFFIDQRYGTFISERLNLFILKHHGIDINHSWCEIIIQEGTVMERCCATCRWLHTDRGLCWCPERGATEDEPVWSEVTAQTEAENRPQDEVCKHWQHD